MKRKKLQLYLLILSLLSLAALVVIQVEWTVRAARMQEAQFNQSVRMAIDNTIDNLEGNPFICEQINSCLGHSGHASCAVLMANLAEWDSLKSVITKDLKNLGIDLDFEFDIVRNNGSLMDNRDNEVYLSRNMEDMLERSGYHLSVRFPGRRDFILSQMENIFIVSIILLAIVTLSSVLIYRFYKRERDFSSNIVDLVNNMTHAFKTPLTNISLANSMIRKSKAIQSNKNLMAYSAIVHDEHRKLKQRVERLMSTSFTETDPALLYEAINLNMMLNDIIGSYDVQINRKKGSISFKEPESPVYVSGNPDLLYIAFSNIIDNSLKYSGVNPVINISVREESGSVMIMIRDKGKGVPEKDLKNIFGKYYRLTSGNHKDDEGFGLGLFQVKNIITRLNGRVWASLPSDGGLLITIELPVIDHE
ncbi:MAG: HAMP domain-containing histidine kinase [Bacteroidales bacterium]|nr:HAMP domain-containing histidine kinase [Bacteroidales bacterium]